MLLQFEAINLTKKNYKKMPLSKIPWVTYNLLLVLIFLESILGSADKIWFLENPKTQTLHSIEEVFLPATNHADSESIIINSDIWKSNYQDEFKLKTRAALGKPVWKIVRSKENCISLEPIRTADKRAAVLSNGDISKEPREQALREGVAKETKKSSNIKAPQESSDRKPKMPSSARASRDTMETNGQGLPREIVDKEPKKSPSLQVPQRIIDREPKIPHSVQVPQGSLGKEPKIPHSIQVPQESVGKESKISPNPQVRQGSIGKEYMIPHSILVPQNSISKEPKIPHSLQVPQASVGKEPRIPHSIQVPQESIEKEPKIPPSLQVSQESLGKESKVPSSLQVPQYSNGQEPMIQPTLMAHHEIDTKGLRIPSTLKLPPKINDKELAIPSNLSKSGRDNIRSFGQEKSLNRTPSSQRLTHHKRISRNLRVPTSPFHTSDEGQIHEPRSPCGKHKHQIGLAEMLESPQNQQAHRSRPSNTSSSTSSTSQGRVTRQSSKRRYSQKPRVP